MTQLFKVPSAFTIASRELENAKRELLVAHATSEHAAKMVEYYAGMVQRLATYIQNESKAQ